MVMQFFGFFFVDFMFWVQGLEFGVKRCGHETGEVRLIHSRP